MKRVAEREPVVRVAEVADPIQVRLALRAITPDVRCVALALEGSVQSAIHTTTRRTHHKGISIFLSGTPLRKIGLSPGCIVFGIVMPQHSAPSSFTFYDPFDLAQGYPEFVSRDEVSAYATPSQTLVRDALDAWILDSVARMRTRALIFTYYRATV